MNSWERLLFDIEHSCICISMFKEKYDIFKNDDNSCIIIVRLDTKGSNSFIIPNEIYNKTKNNSDIESNDENENFLEKIKNIIKNEQGTIKHIDKLINKYNSLRQEKQTSYFRNSWYDKDIIPYNMNINLYERYFDNETNQWIIIPLKRYRGGRYGKTIKLEKEQFSLSSNNLPKITNNQITIGNINDNNHPLYPVLLKLCGQVNSITISMYEFLTIQVSNIQSMEVSFVDITDDIVIDKFNMVIKWLIQLKFSLCDLLTSAIRANLLMKKGIDNGTYQFRFPQRGFKDTSNDDSDIPKEEDRNAKVFLLTISVFCSGTLFYPGKGSLDTWYFNKNISQQNIRLLLKKTNILISILTKKTHGIQEIPLSISDINDANIERALSYLKGERTLFKHQIEGLTWCLNMEKKQDYKGGFIASEMGMGKTIQVLLLHLCYKKKVRGKTLVIAPPGLLKQPWYKEATDSKFWGKDNLPFGKPLLFIKTGSGKQSSYPSINDIQKAELIITSYNILSNQEILKQIPFRRIILDESTYIKTPSAKRSMAVRSIKTDMRWCLSGTPIENKKEDYLGQLLFLQISPFYHQDWWFERFENDRQRMFYNTMFKRNFNNIIDGKLIEYDPILIPMNSNEQNKYNEEKQHYIRSIITSNNLSNQGAQIMNLLKLSRTSNKYDILQYLCGSLVEKRTKFNNILHKAHYNNKLLSCMLLNEDISYKYIKLGNLKPTRNSISKYMDSLKDKKETDTKFNYNNDIELYNLMFQEQISKRINFTWIYESSNNNNDNNDNDNDDNNDDSDSSEWSEDDKPLLDLNELDTLKSKLKIHLNNRDIYKNEKCVIFVQGGERAKEIGNILSKHSVLNKRILIRSSSSSKDANKVIEDFQNNTNFVILILTYRGGAHGLNLQVARNIILLDTDWNPAILLQSIARCYRIGQKRDVYVYTFITKNSFEERVQQVISKKMKILRENIDGVGEDIDQWQDIKQILESCANE